MSNHPREELCPRCGTWGANPPPRGNRRFSGENGSNERYRNNGDRGDYDEYGDDDGHYGPPRRSRDNDNYHEDDRPRHKKTRSSDEGASKKPDWPPQFEASGASFIFDARSGMFYEPRSDFFYDPKTKLYYSNKKRQYFQYDGDKKPVPFEAIGEEGNGGSIGQQQGGEAGAQGGEGVAGSNEPSTMEGAVDTETKPEKVETKPKIAISLKTAIPKDANAKSMNEVATIEKTKLMKENAMKRKESSMSTPGVNSIGEENLPQTHKKHAKDMNLWSERIKEKKVEEDTTAPKKVKTTDFGQPICVLCRRKFSSLEKLQQHEKLSKLHKDNLAKKAAAAAVAAEKKQSDTLYRDRSKERRSMFGSHAPGSGSANGSSSSHAEALLAHSMGTGSGKANDKPAEVIRPEDTLNDTNVGNKMLQRMGWKSGETLGRNAGSSQEANGGGSDLKSDWERIESLAQRGGRR